MFNKNDGTSLFKIRVKDFGNRHKEVISGKVETIKGNDTLGVVEGRL